MQAFPILGLELFQRLQPDREMLPDALAIEFTSHTGELEFTVEGLIRNPEKGTVWHAEAKAVGSDRCRLHVERDRARLRQASDDGGVTDLPVAVVDARDRSGS